MNTTRELTYVLLSMNGVCEDLNENILRFRFSKILSSNINISGNFGLNIFSCLKFTYICVFILSNKMK